MSELRPQNPIMPVEATTFDVCRPKVACPECGTVIGLRLGRPLDGVQCPVCMTRLRVQQADEGWVASALPPRADD